MTLLVLGASSDVGGSLIEFLADRYDSIIAHYLHMNDQLMALKKKYGEKIVLYQADLSDENDLCRLIVMLTDLKSIPSHIVHLPAQKIKLQKFSKIPWEDFENSFEISVRSIIKILQLLLPKMAKEKYGRVAIMLSDAVVGNPPKYSVDYVTTKYALLGLVKSLGLEYADKGITVNGVSPSFIETKFVNELPEFFWEENRKKNPVGRNLVPMDIIPIIDMLLSDEAACINGQNISINCGGNN